MNYAWLAIMGGPRGGERFFFLGKKGEGRGKGVPYLSKGKEGSISTKTFPGNLQKGKASASKGKESAPPLDGGGGRENKGEPTYGGREEKKEGGK